MSAFIRTGSVAAVLLALAYASASQAQQDPKTCSALKDSLLRLNCFDKMFPPDGSSPAQPAPATEAKIAEQWTVDDSKSALDDSPGVFAYLDATTSNASGVMEKNPTLVIRCKESVTSVLISFNRFSYSFEDTLPVTTRIGTDAATTSKWDQSDKHNAVGLWTAVKSLPFLKKLKDNEKLVVRIVSQSNIEAEFDLANVESVIQKTRAACKW